ncbi:MAG: saccharopine dehydrogenase [Alphaproteobacteria bacterium]|nr:MAG: saccharopine dehydrogenase [Alphaproteobacteria bacterium]
MIRWSTTGSRSEDDLGWLMRDVLILGGYGNFGKRIAVALAHYNIPLIIAGRSQDKAEALATQLRREGNGNIRAIALDAESNLERHLQELKPAVVVNTCGPFQNKDYRIAEACLRQKVHYVDLADGREFVNGIARLDPAAKAAGVCVISGASTVPALSSAVVDFYKGEFSEIEELEFGISPGQKTERGLATTEGILTYVGKKLKPARGDQKPRYGWQDLYRQPYPSLGYRWMANCDIPDLDLLPERYGIQKIHFSAGLESRILHFGMFALSWLVRLGLPVNLAQHAPFLLRASHWFDRFGTDDGGMHVIIRGKNHAGAVHERRWFIIATKGDGPQIPCVPAILIAKKLAQGQPLQPGAYPCVGVVGLQEYLGELARFAVKTFDG